VLSYKHNQKGGTTMLFQTPVFKTVSGRHKAIKQLAKEISEDLKLEVTPRMLSGLLRYYLHNEYGVVEIGGYITDIDYRLKCGQKISIKTNVDKA